MMGTASVSPLPAPCPLITHRGLCLPLSSWPYAAQPATLGMPSIPHNEPTHYMSISHCSHSRGCIFFSPWMTVSLALGGASIEIINTASVFPSYSKCPRALYFWFDCIYLMFLTVFLAAPPVALVCWMLHVLLLKQSCQDFLDQEYIFGIFKTQPKLMRFVKSTSM